MNCETIRERIDELEEGTLSPEEAVAVRDHLLQCDQCREFRRDFALIRTALADTAPLSENAQARLWRNLDHRLHRRWSGRLFDFLGAARSWVRDLDRLMVWSRLAALPTTALALAVLLGLFPHGQTEDWNYTIFAARSQPAGPDSAEEALTVQVSQPSGRLKGLMDTAWKIPYEDSLWLTAEIQPDGKAAIGSVIDYPRNPDLLAAVDRTLRDSNFEIADKLVDPVLVYSFQKIDVYEGGTF